MTRAKLEQRINVDVKDKHDRDMFICMLFQGFKVKRILEMLDEYLMERQDQDV